MKRILVLDDDPVIVAFIKKVLDVKGYQTVTATNADDFFSLLREQPIDLVLLDIRMPIKNGFEVFKELRSNACPPVLFVTGDTDSFSVESKTASDLWQKDFYDGTTDIIYKPFSIDILYEKVSSLIGEAAEDVNEQPPCFRSGNQS